ncbi:PIN domain nuclease [candidate division TA06 bacterium]|nr:PIN domain nuclease [candidate division TA06 bacterium]
MNDEWVLIDTSLWINLIRGNVEERIQNEVKRFLAEGRVATTPMVMLELLQGTKTEKEYRTRENRLKALRYFSNTEEVWEASFRLSFHLRQKGLSIPSWDILIAASALHYNCTLLHSDKHFEAIAQHSSLKIRAQ